jgi:glycosyltransferase involved in cell wall biosynthesis
MKDQKISGDTLDITVIIPAYNMEKYILSTLESVKNQTVSPNEVIIVNDGSSDKTQSLIEEWLSVNKLNWILINKTNGGLSSARNAGINACKTKLIALLDSDDQYLPSFIESALKAFHQKSELTLFFANQRVVDENGKKLFDWLENKAIKELNSTCLIEDIFLLKESILPSLVFGNYISCSASVFNASHIIQSGGYDESIKAGEDTEFLLRLLDDKKIAFTYVELANVLRRSDSITQANRCMVHIGRANAIEIHSVALKRHGVDVKQIIQSQFKECYYLSSLQGVNELIKIKKIIKQRSNFAQPPFLKDWFRALFKSLTL